MMEAIVNRITWPLGRDLLRLMRVDRPIGTWLALWPALWALAAARPGSPEWSLVVVILVGAFVVRSAGCVANDLADRHIDPHVERTRDRPLAAGRVSVRTAEWLLFTLLLLAFLLVLTLGWLATVMAFAGAFLAVSYPFMKRFIHTPQLYMGAAFGWGVIIVWAAVAERVEPEAWLLFAATLAWAAGYDTVYAMMDREDDLRIGVKSTAILFGRFDLWAVGGLYALALALLAGVGWRLGAGPFHYLALVAAGVQMGWQLAMSRGYRKERLLTAFKSNQWLGAIVWLGFLLR